MLQKFYPDERKLNEIREKVIALQQKKYESTRVAVVWWIVATVMWTLIGVGSILLNGFHVGTIVTIVIEIIAIYYIIVLHISAKRKKEEIGKNITLPRTDEVVVLHDTYLEYFYTKDNMDYIATIKYECIDTTNCDLDGIYWCVFEKSDVRIMHKKHGTQEAYQEKYDYNYDSIFIPYYIDVENRLSDAIWEKIRNVQS